MIDIAQYKDPIFQMWDKIINAGSTFLKVAVIFVIGWLIAKGLQNLVTKVLKLVKLDMASEKSGLGNMLAKGQIKYTLSELMGILVYWLAMLIVMVLMVNALNLTVAAELLQQIVGYIPNIILAIFVLVLGIFLASAAAALVRTAASNAGIGQAKMLSQVTQVALTIFVIVAALDQLKIAAIIGASFQIILAAVCLGLALAFGLGCKDIAARAMQDFLNSFKK